MSCQCAAAAADDDDADDDGRYWYGMGYHWIYINVMEVDHHY